MWVKICGVTRADDAQACCRAGADAVGLNLFSGPRRINRDRARELLQALAPGTSPVALVGCRAGAIDEEQLGFVQDHHVRHLQLYGGVTSTLLAELAAKSFQVILACPVSGPGFAAPLRRLLDDAGQALPWAVMVDSQGGSQSGGTGRAFPWAWISQARGRGELAGWPRLVLAGGLIPENVAEAARKVRPFGVDVSSGVESEPGVKDHDEIRRFVEAARRTGGDDARSVEEPG